MDNDRREIAERLRAQREASNLSVEAIMAECALSREEYLGYEGGSQDIPIGTLSHIARVLKVDTSALLSGEESHTRVYHLTRRDRGQKVQRRAEYLYEALGSSFQGRVMEPYLVTVEPGQAARLNSHPGQEFDLVLEGRLKVLIQDHQLILEEGDSLYFDSGRPHGMEALGGARARFLAVISSQGTEKR